MRSFKIYIVIFLSAVLFSSIGKSNNYVAARSTLSKLSCYKLSGNHSPRAKTSITRSVNKYTRNKRSVKEDDVFLSDAIQQTKIHYEKPIKFLPFAKQRLYSSCYGLIPSRAPPAL